MASSRAEPPWPLFGAIDMGTSSFKLLIVQAHPNGLFLPLHRRKEPVVLGRGHATPFSISDHSHALVIDSLLGFKSLLDLHNVSASRTRCVATSAVREASNRAEFLDSVRARTGFHVHLLTGDEEARLAYLSSIQFFPLLYEGLTLCVDIGGGSTEFVVGVRGQALFACSLRLGHVSLSEMFRGKSVEEVREYVRRVIGESGLVGNVRRLGFDVVVGSSGTIRALEKAAFYGYGGGNSGGVFDEAKRGWRLSRVGLSGIVERLVGEEEEEDRLMERERFFKRRSEFIVAGAVLLEEIIEALGVEDMEVSGFALAEGMLAEILSGIGGGGGDFSTNVRWRSAVRLATRYNGKKRMDDAAKCVGIAKEIFEALKKCDKLGVYLEDKDLEYVEIACLLHSIGLVAAKKGYHKQSYSIIMNGEQLQGYSAEEVKLIALLARHHRKKFPKLDHSSFKELPKEVKKKFKFLCSIIRVTVALWQHQSTKVQVVESSQYSKGFNFESVFRDLEDQNIPTESDKNMEDLRRELEYFKMVFHQDLSSVISYPRVSGQLCIS